MTMTVPGGTRQGGSKKSSPSPARRWSIAFTVSAFVTIIAVFADAVFDVSGQVGLVTSILGGLGILIAFAFLGAPNAVNLAAPGGPGCNLIYCWLGVAIVFALAWLFKSQNWPWWIYSAIIGSIVGGLFGLAFITLVIAAIANKYLSVAVLASSAATAFGIGAVNWQTVAFGQAPALIVSSIVQFAKTLVVQIGVLASIAPVPQPDPVVIAVGVDFGLLLFFFASLSELVRRLLP
jgi:hypothetical protein